MPRTVIVGCGRVGAGLAARLAQHGYTVTVIDINGDAFRRLDDDFTGEAIRGDGTDEDVLRRAGTDGADLFFALTEGDNRNVLTAQLAVEIFGVREVVAKVNDPVRADAYRALGLNTICRTTMLVDALAGFATSTAGGGAGAGVGVAAAGTPGAAGGAGAPGAAGRPGAAGGATSGPVGVGVMRSTGAHPGGEGHHQRRVETQG